MSTPVLHLLAGPNGAGKTTYVDRVLRPVNPLLPFVNADLLAAERWPDSPETHAYEAARMAHGERRRLMEAHRSFITETVFSHPSKLDLVNEALSRGYIVRLWVILVPVEVTLRRVLHRVERGGHSVPAEKVRERYARLWQLVRKATLRADHAQVLDNSLPEKPFRRVATYERGRLIGETTWPSWAPPQMRE